MRRFRRENARFYPEYPPGALAEAISNRGGPGNSDIRIRRFLGIEIPQRRGGTPHRHSAQVALAALKSDKTLAEWAQQYDLHPNQITDWKRPLTERAVQVFGDASSPASSDPDLTKLHAKIGQLTLENDFLEHALTKAGLLSARR
ncbi:Mobile element protein [Candidatus Accumulibacter phosphatis]|uniref:Mobile element protein n=1 Tax=Candidatus Accumulibacter phosphatis TaxID=327160 RepID=A0A5S4ETQ9_9PROT|nr:Mobile element protein [Candidatus Accumulibacter phosphatis]